MRYLFYKFLAYMFYYIGDCLSRLPLFPYTIYSWAMRKSLDYDEKIGYVMWKEPTLNRD